MIDTMLAYKYTGLIFDCPFKDELETCPYRFIRELTIKDRFKVYENLSSESRLTLVECHLKCSRKREEKQIIAVGK
jgi:hypothetical protein